MINLHEANRVGSMKRGSFLRIGSVLLLLISFLVHPSRIQAIESSPVAHNEYYYEYSCQHKARYYQTDNDLSLHLLLQPPIRPLSKNIRRQAPITKAELPKSSDINALIDKYGQEYNVDKELMKRMAYCESGYNPNAVNGPYLGLYQFQESTWSATRRRMGLDTNPALRTHAEEAIRTTAYKISQDGVGAWPVCGKQ